MAEEKPLTVSEAGRKGGQVTAARYHGEAQRAAGRKGAQRVKELIARGKELECGSGREEAAD